MLGVGDAVVYVWLETEAAAEEIKARGEEDPRARPDDGGESEEVEGVEEVDVESDTMEDGSDVRPSNDISVAVTVETLKDAWWGVVGR